MKSMYNRELRNRKFFETLYKDNYNDICTYISVITFNKLDYESLAQDVFLIAFQKIDVLRHHINPTGWLYSTARNITMDALKKKMNTYEIPTSIEELDKCAVNPPELEDIFCELEGFLTSDEIRLLKKHFKEGQSISDIAQQCNIKTGTMRMKFSRMYKKIKNLNIFNISMLLFAVINQYYK